jgi:hypothetical protein
LYVKDDSLDFSDGYVGTVENALTIQPFEDGNWCIELDNIGAARSDLGQPFDTPPVTSPTVRNYTCITSNRIAGTHGDSAGFRIRQGGRATITNSLVFGGYATAEGRVGTASNRCFRPESSTTLRDMQDSRAPTPLVSVASTVFACEVLTSGSLPNGTTFANWLAGVGDYAFNVGNVSITDPANANVALLTPGSYFTATTLRDAAGNVIPAPVGGLGAVRQADDWTSPWAFGLRAGNRAQPLWFE